MPTFIQTPIPTYTEATMLTFTPPVAPNLFFFYNADHNNSLYSMDSNQAFAFVSAADEDCRCEIVESWMCAINTALKNNQMTPDQYAAALAEGIIVSDNGGVLSVGPNFPAVISLTVTPTAKSMTVSPTPFQLVQTLLPANADQRVVWTTSDATKVSVDQHGNITALASGTATITVISVADPSKTATCVVTVS